jgi:uncharacterized membrane protein
VWIVGVVGGSSVSSSSSVRRVYSVCDKECGGYRVCGVKKSVGEWGERCDTMR